MRVAVTGGAGFIGAHLVRALVARGDEVVVIDNLSGGYRSRLVPGIEFRRQSIVGPLDFRGVEVVFHLAALPRVQRSLAEPGATHEVNVNGTLSVLLQARDAQVQRVVFSSSSSVYGDQEQLPLLETMTPNPKSPYALHKRIGEEYCELFAKLGWIDTVCLRYFNVYGPGMEANGAYANLIPRAAMALSEEKIPTINGDGEQRRDFTYVSDVVQANLLAAQVTGKGRAFNIGSGQNYSVNEVVAMIARYLSITTTPIHGPALIEPRNTQAGIELAKHELQWAPKVGLPEGLVVTMQDYR